MPLVQGPIRVYFISFFLHSTLKFEYFTVSIIIYYYNLGTDKILQNLIGIVNLVADMCTKTIKKNTNSKRLNCCHKSVCLLRVLAFMIVNFNDLSYCQIQIFFIP